MKNVLFLTTYPFVKPRHGGQIRSAKICEQYKKRKWNVTSIAVYEPEGYAGDDVGPSDVIFPPNSKYRYYNERNVPLINDLLSGDFSCAEDGGFPLIEKRLPKKIDVIHIEQAWLWPLAKKIKNSSQYSKVKIVYGSQNIEYQLKEKIFAQYNIEKTEQVISDIFSLEKEAALNADLVIAVTDDDAKEIISWGREDVIIAANGIEPWYAEPDRIEHWKKKLPNEPWILYIASAHPPNFTGFNECIGDSLACIPPSSKLVVVGSVCEHIYKEVINSKFSSINISRLELLYLLDDKDLAAVKSLAHAYFLPIIDGGGSNLKTAEALYSGSFVIGTDASFRGFEAHKDSPRVYTFDSPTRLHEIMREVLSFSRNKINNEDEILINKLTWEHALSGFLVSMEAKFEEEI